MDTKSAKQILETSINELIDCFIDHGIPEKTIIALVYKIIQNRQNKQATVIKLRVLKGGK